MLRRRENQWVPKAKSFCAKDAHGILKAPDLEPPEEKSFDNTAACGFKIWISTSYGTAQSPQKNPRAEARGRSSCELLRR